MTPTMMIRRDSCVIAGLDDGSLIRSGGHVFCSIAHVPGTYGINTVYIYILYCLSIYHMFVCTFSLSLSHSLSPICFCFSSCIIHCNAAVVCWVYYYIIRCFSSSNNFAPWFLGVLLLWISTDRERVMDFPPSPPPPQPFVYGSTVIRNKTRLFFFDRFFFHLFFFSFPMSIWLRPTGCKVGTSGNVSRRSL